MPPSGPTTSDTNLLLRIAIPASSSIDFLGRPKRGKTSRVNATRLYGVLPLPPLLLLHVGVDAHRNLLALMLPLREHTAGLLVAVTGRHGEGLAGLAGSSWGHGDTDNQFLLLDSHFHDLLLSVNGLEYPDPTWTGPLPARSRQSCGFGRGPILLQIELVLPVATQSQPAVVVVVRGPACAMAP